MQMGLTWPAQGLKSKGGGLLEEKEPCWRPRPLLPPERPACSSPQDPGCGSLSLQTSVLVRSLWRALMGTEAQGLLGISTDRSTEGSRTVPRTQQLLHSRDLSPLPCAGDKLSWPVSLGHLPEMVHTPATIPGSVGPTQTPSGCL